MRTIEVKTTLELIDCADCHIQFGVPQSMAKRLRRTGAVFYCPSGHDNVFRVEPADPRLEEEARAVEERGLRLLAERKAARESGESPRESVE